MSLSTIWTLPACTLREKLNRTAEWSLRRAAHRIPRRLAYWSFIDTGVRHMGNDVVPEITYVEVLRRAGDEVAS